jgi:EAL domain-containing protein (putative c-di-GMP-specific phosphodiesterase class I)
MELSVLLDSPDPGAALRIAFQPIVDLDTEEVVAHEALVRGPAGSALEQPAALFAAAAATGRVPGLDWACRSAALRTALALRWEGPLFLNVEPATLGSPPPTGHEALIAAAVEELDIVLEITERSITARPADLLGAVRWARSKGWGVAVDDIGADPGSLALLPLLRPDVIKLDRGLIQRRPDAWTASVMTAVHATAERTGASVLAEGIETEDHLRAGHGLGADLGQGFHFGRPEGSPRAVTAPWTVRSPVVELPMGATPYEVIARHSHVRQATKPMLVAISKHLESEAAGLSSPG